MVELLKYSEYLDTALAVLVAGHALAIAIVNLTPTPKDDRFVAKAYVVIEALAGIFSHKNVKK